MNPSLPQSSHTVWPRIGQHHFAHLRAVAEGLPVQESALRYLGIDHGHQAVTAHRQVVDRLRGLARRRGLSAWRLVGLTIRVGSGDIRPSLEDFIAERELDGWTESEVAQLYEEAFPADARAERRRRLRDRQLALLKELQAVAAERPSPEDRLDGWFDPVTAQRLTQAGMLLLRDLQQRIQGGGHWWRGLPAIGKIKADRLAQYLQLLLPDLANPLPRPFENSGIEDIAPQARAGALVSDDLFSGRPVTRGAPGTAVLTGARSDAEVIEAWVAARAGTAPTAKSYRREALRLLLWLRHERAKGFADVQVEDCLDYMSFLEHLPPAWISRRHSTVLGEGWAPFRGPLSLASRRQAVVVLGSFFGWMVNVGYLPSRNPWMLINRRTGDDAHQSLLDSRAFTPEAWAALLGHLQAETPDASRARMLFILTFVEATGLRAAELVGATMGALRQHRGRWVLQVHGKGARNRLVAVPGQARDALQDYLLARGLGPLGQQPPDTPLLARLSEPQQAIGYQALYQTMKRWVRDAIRGSELTSAEKDVAMRASPHWLRHTFGTRALERRAPLEVVQRQLGHADPRTTMRYAHAQLERLQQEMDRAFGDEARQLDQTNKT
ncbi:tyrosine-type recombinase/integrase [Ideonella oryzae]|uniref:Site-specific integrase n=1 Tax=Ideonella oryzae TaxID=2937441 RepID=A0ABT1BGD1_9BURK|nr:tyrosine-type recombinase/integrase [Ideonella oryzae]MCO5975260.1 site-specific integrase [Ideonella oryzae]